MKFGNGCRINRFHDRQLSSTSHQSDYVTPLVTRSPSFDSDQCTIDCVAIGLIMGQNLSARSSWHGCNLITRDTLMASTTGSRQTFVSSIIVHFRRPDSDLLKALGLYLPEHIWELSLIACTNMSARSYSSKMNMNWHQCLTSKIQYTYFQYTFKANLFTSWSTVS